MRAHLRRWDVARIHRRVARRDHRQQRRLRPLELQRHLEVAIGADVGNVAEQILARILAEFVLPFPLDKVESAFHVLSCERLAGSSFFACYDGNATRYGSPDQLNKSKPKSAIFARTRCRLPTVRPHRTMAL